VELWAETAQRLTDEVQQIVELISLLLSCDWQTNVELWAETAQRLTDEVQQIIEFAKFIPGFISLLQDDQIMLLKGGTYCLCVCV